MASRSNPRHSHRWRWQWRWDSWYCQPWAWIWSDLERDRLGRWGLVMMAIVSWYGPWVAIMIGLCSSLPLGLAGGWVIATLTLLGIVDALYLRGRIRAWQAGWRTCFWGPTSWGVRRLTEHAVHGSPTHWADVPHWERHTLETRWPTPDAFREARQAEWARWAACSGEPPQAVLIAHTFSTIRGVPDAYWRAGTPLRVLPRRLVRQLPVIQRRMFGRPYPRRGGDVGRPEHWRVVALPLIAGFACSANPTESKHATWRLWPPSSPGVARRRKTPTDGT